MTAASAMIDSWMTLVDAGGWTLGAIAGLSWWMWFTGLRLLSTLERGEATRLMERLGNEAATLRRLGLCSEKLTKRLEKTAVLLTAPLRRRLPRVAVLASCAPLLGLLGTVAGMIAAFDTITVVGSADPRAFAGGISHALVTTEAGLLVALPGLILHGRLRSRLDDLDAAARAEARRLAGSEAY